MTTKDQSAPADTSETPAELPEPVTFGPETIEGRAIELMKAAGIDFYITQEGIPSYPHQKAFSAVMATLEMVDAAKRETAGETRRGDSLERELALSKNRQQNIFIALKVIQSRYAMLISNLANIEGVQIDTSGDLSGDAWAEASVKAMTPSAHRY